MRKTHDEMITLVTDGYTPHAMVAPLRVAIFDRSSSFRRYVIRMLDKHPPLKVVGDGDAAQDVLDSIVDPRLSLDAIALDRARQDAHGIELLPEIRDRTALNHRPTGIPPRHAC